MELEPLSPAGRVWVYRYMYWDEATNGHKQSELYATVEVIKCGLGVPLYATGIQVTLAELHDGGIYVPPAREIAFGPGLE